MEKGKIKLTQEQAENTPAGGVVVGKRDGQTMIYDDASLGGYFVGKLHSEGGIQMINKSTGQPLEVQGSEVIITAPAVNDQTKHNFNGKMMTNREILSKINSDGGGVSFADGGDIPAKIHTTEKEYEYGGKMVHDSEIANHLGMNSTLKKGKQHFTSGNKTYDVDAIYNAIKKGKLRLKTKEVETFAMKYPVYDKKYSETVKTDFRKPNGLTVRTESGKEVLIDGNHRMNNAYLKGRKTMKTYYIEDPKQIAKFTKNNKFELGGENKVGGHLSKNKSLKQIAEMHNVTLAHINEQLAKGLEVEKEHFADFKERTRVAKDHLVENPDYYTILAKAGLKRGGHIQKQELVENSKKGDTPARDLNNYNDIMDLEADGMVGMESGLAFAKGGGVDSNNSNYVDPAIVEKLKDIGFDVYREQKSVPILFFGEPTYYPLETPDGKKTKMVILGSQRTLDGFKQEIFIVNWRGSDWYVITFSDLYRKKCFTRVIEGKIINGQSQYFEFKPNVTPITLIEEKVTKQYQRKIVFHQTLEAIRVLKEIILKDLPIPNLEEPQAQGQTIKDDKITIKEKKKIEDVDDLSELLEMVKSGNYANGGQLENEPKEGDLITNFGNYGVSIFDVDTNYVYWLDQYASKQFCKKSDLSLNNLDDDGDDDGYYEQERNSWICNKPYAYDNGGLTPYDANQEGDSVSILSTGGGVGLPKVAYVKVTNTGASLTNLLGNKYNSYIEFAESVKEAYKPFMNVKPIRRSFVELEAYDENDKKLVSASTYIADQKNTVKNFNPTTGNYKNLEKSLDNSRPVSFKKYDWEDWFLSKGITPIINSQKQTTSNASKELDLKDTKVWIGDDTKLSEEIQKAVFSLGWGWGYKGADKVVKDNIYAQAFYFDEYNVITYSSGISGRSFYELNKGKELNPQDILLAKKPTITTSSNQSQYPEYYEFVGINGNDFTKGKIYKIKNPKDLKASGNFMDDTGIFNGYGNSNDQYFKPSTEQAFLAQQSGASNQQFDLSLTKIVLDDSEASEKVQKRAFELGWSWNGLKEVKYTDERYMYFDKEKNISSGSNFDVFRRNQFKEIFEHNLFGTQPKYPEYYEFVDDTVSDSFTKGKIYKIRNPKDIEAGQNFTDNNGILNGFSGSNSKYFKPSTEQAYLGQQKGVSSISLIEPKIVDAVNVEFIYPNGRLEVSATINISNLKNALANFWNMVDKKSWEVRITPFENQFTPFYEKKLIIGSDFAEYNPETFSEEQLGNKLKTLYPDLDWSIFLKEKTSTLNKMIVVKDVSLMPNVNGGVTEDYFNVYDLYSAMVNEQNSGTQEVFITVNDGSSLNTLQVFSEKVNIEKGSKPYGKLLGSINNDDFKNFLTKNWFPNNNLDWSEFFQEKAPATTSAKSFDFTDTKINVKNNPELSLKVQKKAFEDGWEWENNGGKVLDYNNFNYLYFTKTSISFGNTASSFINSPKREITEAEIFGSKTPTISLKSDKEITSVDLSYEVNGNPTYYSGLTTGKDFIEAINNVEQYNPNQDVQVRFSFNYKELNNTGGFSRESSVRYFTFGKGAFKPSNWTVSEIKSIVEDDWLDNEYDFDKFFSDIVSMGSTTSKPFDFSNTKIWIGDNPELSKRVQEKAFESGIYWVDDTKSVIQQDKPCLNFEKYGGKTVITFRYDREEFDKLKLREITEAEIFGTQTKEKVKFLKATTDEEIKEVTNVSKLKKFIEDSYLIYGKGKVTLNVNGDTSKSAFFISYGSTFSCSTCYDIQTEGNKRIQDILLSYEDSNNYDWSDFFENEVKSISFNYSNQQYRTEYKDLKSEDFLDAFKQLPDNNPDNEDIVIGITVNYDGKSIDKIFTATVYPIDPNNPKENLISIISDGKEVVDFIKKKLFPELNFDKYFGDISSSNSVVPKIIADKKLTDFKEIANQLEVFALKASEKYYSEAYEDSLSLLKEVKQQYSFALSFTPESSFMYERIELMKKIAEIQKEITRISELKNGGAYYILSKVIEKLDTGENWKQSVGEILTNEVPQQEIDAVIHTEKFKNWFGDWETAIVTKENDYVSKAVNENGIPSVMYHGAKRIKYSYRQVSNGVLYLAENRSYAEWFSAVESPFQKQGDYLTQCFVNLKNPIDLTPLGVDELDLRDIIRFIDTFYPLAKIYDVLQPNTAMQIMNNNLIGGQLFRAWNIIRQYPKLNEHIRDNTSYDGFIYYENNPSDMIINQSTGNMEQNITKATAVFNSNQVKLVDAVLFDGSLDDWRFETGGKVN